MKIIFKALALFMVLISPYALAQGVDEMWEISGTMEMEGMKVPLPVTRTCMKKDTPAEPPTQENCRISNVAVSGNKTSWKVNCDEPDKMEGSGEITKTTDKMEGTVRLSSADGNMTMHYSGRRVGACTAVAVPSVKKK
jgi:Protein of unknown function (DUF3617)